VWLLDLLALLFLLCVVCTVLFRYVEKVAWEEAIWQVWQTVTTVGYGNRPAQTSAGRWIVMLFGLGAIAILGPTIAAAFDWRVESRNRRAWGQMDNPHRNGYVVFNFPGASRFEALVRELRSIPSEQDVGICVVDSHLEELPHSIAAMPQVAYVRGSILERATYERAALRQNKTVIVLPQDKEEPATDAITRVVVQQVAEFVGNDTRIMHVLVDQNHAWLFEGLPSTAILGSLEIFALVQECQGRYSALALETLLLNTEGADPVTVEPKRIVGWTWRELRLRATAASDLLQVPLNPLALVHGGKVNASPSNDDRIDSGDFIMVTAHGALDWDRFETAMCDGKPAGG
jgi:hypothetical protein